MDSRESAKLSMPDHDGLGPQAPLAKGLMHRTHNADMRWFKSIRAHIRVAMYQGWRETFAMFLEEFDSLAIHMDEKLYEWLEKMFTYSTVPKYRKYFTEWVENITEDQIIGFKRMMGDNK